MALFARILIALAAAHAFAPRTLRTAPQTRRHLFGGGKKDGGGGGALGQVAGVMDQFKKAQEIAKKSQELQQELAAAEFEGSDEGGLVTFTMNGQQGPVKCTAPGFDGADAETLGKAYLEAMQKAQANSLAAMNEKMQALYKSVGLGGEGGMPGM
mmetsp:Transcript_24398/g.73219  ORF Transcript_24398/g.73219 Transcript_24398/m.73219 type:complete len:155 (-) Transcript_24398:25-489(-)